MSITKKSLLGTSASAKPAARKAAPKEGTVAGGKMTTARMMTLKAAGLQTAKSSGLQMAKASGLRTAKPTLC